MQCQRKIYRAEKVSNSNCISHEATGRYLITVLSEKQTYWQRRLITKFYFGLLSALNWQVTPWSCEICWLYSNSLSASYQANWALVFYVKYILHGLSVSGDNFNLLTLTCVALRYSVSADDAFRTQLSQLCEAAPIAKSVQVWSNKLQ